MKNKLWNLAMIFFVSATILLSIRSVNLKDDEKYYYQNYKQSYRIFSPEVPKDIDFAGEKVPTDTFYVYENLEREILVNTYWHSNTLLLFKRANRWFPVIEPILKANNMPEDFKYLALIESGFLNITSPSGAKGFWQLLKGTATDYGLEINDQIDERNNLEKSTQAACKYLSWAHNKFGNWSLVAASYNMGVNGIQKQLDNQKVNSYYDLSINSETSRYLFRILALKAIFSNPTQYGFYLRQADLYPIIVYDILEVDSSISNIPDFAKNYNLSYKMIKELNPWILTTSLPNTSSKIYLIKIPQKDMTNYFKLKDGQSKNLGIFGDRKVEE